MTPTKPSQAAGSVAAQRNPRAECGVVEQTMHIAHIEAYRIAGNNADDNLRTLCEPCHKLEAGR